jgi:hypothetical protein
LSYTDFTRLQNFVGHYLCSNNAFDRINIVTRERLLADASRLPDETIAIESLVYITPREGGDGRTGIGVIIEKPGFVVQSPNLPGPEGFITLQLLILEDRLTNLGPTTGTELAADQLGQMLMDALHWHQIEGFGQMFCDNNAMVVAEDFAPLIGYRLNFKIRMPRAQTEKVAQPTITEDAGTVTLACSTADAQIYYTTDESFPGRSNPAAVLYSEPFPAAVGTVINVAAYKEGLTPSHMIQATVT